MLNPPISLLSNELLACIVEHVAELSFRDRQLQSLSLADRAFTYHCQKFLCQTLRLNGSNRTISKKLKKIGRILEDNPLLANNVRVVQLSSFTSLGAFLFNDPTLISTFQLLAESPRPPHELVLRGYLSFSVKIKDPILIVERFTQSFFSQTLTTLTLSHCKNVPVSFFLICPRLREVTLDGVAASKESHDQYPDELCSGRESPALERFSYRNAHSLVKQITTPPPRFHTPVVLWSNLRVLTLSPHEQKEMALLQSILDMACNTLEELFLTSMQARNSYEHFLLAALVNLRDLSFLRVFALYIVINSYPQCSTVLHDINIVLDTIPASNRITNLMFYITIVGEHPFRESLDQDWVGLCDQVIRISDERPLELDLQTLVDTGSMDNDSPGEHVLYSRILEKLTRLSDYPHVCTHFWNPGDWLRGLAPFPRDEVRSRCRL